MRTFVSNDQTYNIVDTTQRLDPVQVILRATDSTPIYWSQERADLEGNLDNAGVPRAGMLLLNTDPPLVLTGFRGVVWARSVAPTTLECQVIAQRVGIAQQPPGSSRFPGAAPPVRPPTGNVKLPGFEISWTRKGGVQ